MAIKEGTGRFGLWPVSAAWDDEYIHRVWFGRSGSANPLHPALIEYLAGRRRAFDDIRSPAGEGDSVSDEIYRVVQQIPYGETRTYTEVAAAARTHPRVVGGALRRNPTPIVIPCHRVVGKKDIGGFTPDLRIKSDLLALEADTIQKGRLNRGNRI
ncbi:MAG: methylated-DNA--[protein]-cysteine S-methyltransferase [Methanocalculus sp. MSAO_Arc2]|uniref:methylated-DNA--[protein]-cysteine S-methyltransferase n=1 Tax=Methanocalculus sp. MSAO_Arc2 TaxID=2293855 RepID=UPI000FF5C21C|nr:MAG: methylated-DNA--[protein]-cysteine S-methyltransferase [Methanocalculus sp. MSAO_Arc2]